MAIRPSTTHSIYRAPDPTLASRCFFRIEQVGSFFTRQLAQRAMPALNPALSASQIDLLRSKKALAEQTKGHFIAFETPHGAKIEGLYIPNEKATKTILFALSEGGAFEKLLDPKHPDAPLFAFLRKEFGEEVSFLVINYSEIGLSEGKASLEDWAIDLYSAFAYLKESKQTQVLLYGRSLGAYLSLKACEHIYDQFEELPPVIADGAFTHPREWAYPLASEACLLTHLKLAVKGMASPVSKFASHSLLELKKTRLPQPEAEVELDSVVPPKTRTQISHFVRQHLS